MPKIAAQFPSPSIVQAIIPTQYSNNNELPILILKDLLFPDLFSSPFSPTLVLEVQVVTENSPTYELCIPKPAETPAETPAVSPTEAPAKAPPRAQATTPIIISVSSSSIIKAGLHPPVFSPVNQLGTLSV